MYFGEDFVYVIYFSGGVMISKIGAHSPVSRPKLSVLKHFFKKIETNVAVYIK